MPTPYPAGYVERVYQVTVEGRDQSPTPSLPNVMQALVEAALNDFPGVSGQSRTNRV
ncbi:MAG: hypothetical protein MO853_08935 [Candidatus Protistobacter heckmanni]|nr:hypothetical protein [Candidatus Protistobacter heckmanni]